MIGYEKLREILACVDAEQGNRISEWFVARGVDDGAVARLGIEHAYAAGAAPLSDLAITIAGAFSIGLSLGVAVRDGQDTVETVGERTWGRVEETVERERDDDRDEAIRFVLDGLGVADLADLSALVEGGRLSLDEYGPFDDNFDRLMGAGRVDGVLTREEAEAESERAKEKARSERERIAEKIRRERVAEIRREERRRGSGG